MPDVPVRPRRPRTDVQAYAPCLLCGAMVLTGETLHGEVLHLDTARQCYAITWSNAAITPTLLPSRAYPQHRCVSGAGTDGV